jgi:hypothetical protein
VSAGLKSFAYIITAWLLAVLYIASAHFADPDLWGRLSVAALYFQNGQFPYYDVFSYTAPHARWIDHEWLTGMVFYQIITNLGESGFLAFKYGSILAIFYLLFRLHRKCYHVSPLYALYGLVITIDAYSVGLYATLRSHIFSFVLFVLFVYVLERVRLGQRSPWLLWWLVPVGVVWANFHGGFIMGIILLGIYGIDAVLQARVPLAVSLYWGIATCIFILLAVLNPYGPDYLGFLWHAWTLDRSRIGEWSHMRFNQWDFLPGQLLIVAGVTVPLLRWLMRDRRDNGEQARLLVPVLVLCWLAVMAIRGVRFQPFLAFGIVAYAPLILSPDFLHRALPKACCQFFQQHTAAFKNVLPALLLGMALAGTIYMQATVNLLKVPLGDEFTQGLGNSIRYPLGAILFLERSPYRGNLSVRYGYGEFAYWCLYPKFKVSMDGRYEEVYTQAEFLKNDAFYDRINLVRAQAAVEPIERSNTDFILTEVDMSNVKMLLLSKRWQEIYSDQYFTVLGRNSTLNRYPASNSQRFQTMVNNKVFTIADMVTPADLKRFRN